MRKETGSAVDSLAAMWKVREAAAAMGPKPAGAFTVSEYASRYEIPYNTAHGQIEGMRRKGMLKRSPCYVLTDSGRTRCSFAYMLVKQ